MCRQHLQVRLDLPSASLKGASWLPQVVEEELKKLDVNPYVVNEEVGYMDALCSFKSQTDLL
jgi:hypothetical protein